MCTVRVTQAIIIVFSLIAKDGSKDLIIKIYGYIAISLPGVVTNSWMVQKEIIPGNAFLNDVLCSRCNLK